MNKGECAAPGVPLRPALRLKAGLLRRWRSLGLAAGLVAFAGGFSRFWTAGEVAAAAGGGEACEAAASVVSTC